MSVVKELKQFMMRGNVVDMAVGVIIGAAFSKIVTSLVSDIITPTIGLFLYGVNLKDLSFELIQATAEAPAVTLNYGSFVQTIFDFIIISTVIFFVIKGINKLKGPEKVVEEAPAEPVPTKEEVLLSEIRDILKDKK